MASDLKLPDISSADLILTQPTADERRQIWSRNHNEWGRGLTHDSYLKREAYLLDLPSSRDGGLTNWILTTAEPAQRPILASCETLRRRILVRGEDGSVRDAWGYGVASVFTFQELRGKGYASKMIALLRDHLAKLHRDSGDSPCSVLYSDVGKKFYAAHGWMPDRSTTLEVPLNQSPTHGGHECVQPITDEDVPALARIDEGLLRRELSSARETNGPHKVRVAFVPSAGLHAWHFTRDDFYCDYTFHRTPTVRGALYTLSSGGASRVWVVWTRVYNGGVEKPEKNVLYINRLVVEDESMSDAELSQALAALWDAARSEALEWQLAKISIWNPSDRVRRLLSEMEGLEVNFIVREDDSVTSINWFGKESVDQVEWVANERFAWC